MRPRITDEAVARARAVPVEDEIDRRGIKLTGRGAERVGPCPVCGGTDRFSINIRKQVFNCRGAGGGDVIALVRHIDGCTFPEAVETLAGEERRDSYDPLRAMAERVRAHLRRLEEKAGEEARGRRALEISVEALHPRGTAVEAYFACRRLTLPDEAAGEAIRFHPACPFGRARVPAIVALVRDVQSNEPKAIHRTALDTEGRKAWVDGNDRRLLGPASGGAVKLTPDEDITLCLGVGEGIESTLSLRLAREFGASPVWALLSAGQVRVFPALAGIETLWIAVDHDSEGVSAANSAARTWHRAGREVFLIKPHTADTDLNDIIRRNPDA